MDSKKIAINQTHPSITTIEIWRQHITQKATYSHKKSIWAHPSIAAVETWVD